MKPLLRSSRIITLSDIRFHYGEVGCNWPRWLAELTNYNFSITYRSGKHNADADGLSHLQDSNDTVTLFSDVLKTAYKSSMMVPDVQPLTETLAGEAVITTVTDHMQMFQIL